MLDRYKPTTQCARPLFCLLNYCATLNLKATGRIEFLNQCLNFKNFNTNDIQSVQKCSTLKYAFNYNLKLTKLCEKQRSNLIPHITFEYVNHDHLPNNPFCNHKPPVSARTMHQTLCYA